MRKIPGILLCIYITLALSLSVTVTNAQKETSDTTYDEGIVMPPDEKMNEVSEDAETEGNGTIEPIIREVSEDTILSLKGQKEFYYMAYLDSLLRNANTKEVSKPKEAAKVETQKEQDHTISVFDIGIVKFICWAVAIGILGYVIYKLFIGNNPMFAASNKKALPEVEIAEEEMDEDNLDNYMQKAIRAKNYRLAVRYQFLKTLQRLGEKGILKLSIDKTNHQYAGELMGKPYANAFARLSLQYEYAWFGGFELNEEQFAFVQQQHTLFLKDI